ncbi:hypothetical protein [Vulcanisaeta souniana]|uniref:hypothetical protein n=1 Tax=Vulcanisaeta souniana TaxID=164452 RepID=UPI000B1E1F30|nr:hypothetical protein [Vulcanisaeta souniana]
MLGILPTYTAFWSWLGGWGGRVGRKTSYTIHALLRASGYNADEGGLASRARLPMPCRLRLT